MTEIRAHLAGEVHAGTQADVDSDLDPTATSDNAPAAGGAPFVARRRWRHCPRRRLSPKP